MTAQSPELRERRGWADDRATGRLLVLAEEFVEVLSEADDDHEEGAGDADEEKPGGEGHGGMGEGEHRGIVNQLNGGQLRTGQLRSG